MQQINLKPKQGYKFVKSTFGKFEEIPIDWDVVRLGKIINVQGGFSFKSEDYVGDGIRLLKISNVSHGETIWDEVSYLPSGYADQYQDYLLKDGDILIAMTRPIIGNGLKIASVSNKDLPCLFNQRVGRLRLKDNVSLEFIFYIFLSKKIYDEIKRRSDASHQPNISAKEIENIHIVLPPRGQQQKIALIFSLVDSLIQQTQKIIEKTQRLKKGLVRKLLTEGIGHTKFKKVTLFPRYNEETVPEGWDVDRLNNLVKIIDYRGRTPPFSQSGIPHLRSNNIRNGQINFDDITFVSEKTYEEYMTRGIPQEDDVLFTTEGPLGEVALVPKTFKFSLAQRIIVLRPKSTKITSKFLKYLLLDRKVRIRYEALATGTTVGGVASKWFTKLFLPYPENIAEQQQIAKVLSRIEEQIKQAQEYKSKLETLKKGLGQKLLTGQIRVKV